MQSIDLLQNDVRLLGADGSKGDDAGTSCLQVSKNIVIDAGNIIQGLGEDAAHIEHIFLTHSHLDHIVDLAFVVERYFHTQKKPLKIYGLKETLIALKKHYFNNTIWPDFTQIKINNSLEDAIELIEIELYKTYTFDNCTLKAIPVNHTVATCAYVIEKPLFSFLYAPDTYLCDTLWEEINTNPKIDSLMIDLSFPSASGALAQVSGHLTPSLLAQGLQKCDKEILVYAIHLKEAYRQEIVQEVREHPKLKERVHFLPNGAYLKKGLLEKKEPDDLEMLTTLAKEKNLETILEQILVHVMKRTRAEGGTVYLKQNNKLHFKVVINKKLHIHNTHTENWPPIELYTPHGSNLSNVSALCAIKNEIINIPDVYHEEGFNFEGMRKFDKANNYRSKSMLVIPMVDHEEDIIGVLQLINKLDHNGEVIPFSRQDIHIAQAYSAYCAIAITKNRLIEDLEKLLLSFLESIAVAMDAKSPVGYGHISRVGRMMEIFSEAIDKDQTKYKDIRYDRDDLLQLKLAAWMHDIGKIATPEAILNKSTKLETIYNRIAEIEERFRSVILSLKLALQEKKVAVLEGKISLDIKEEERKTKQQIKALHEELQFIKRKNLPSGLMSDEDIAYLEKIAAKEFIIEGEVVKLLKPDEVKNLAIRYGTLNEEERAKINEHAKISNDMLNMLVFPKKFKEVPKIAGMHHEKLNGEGYPNGVKGDEIPFEARLLAIIDIFEALTAHDRPYKRPKTLTETYEILDNMVKEGALDGEIIEYLKQSGLFEAYAKKYLLPQQIR